MWVLHLFVVHLRLFSAFSIQLLTLLSKHQYRTLGVRSQESIFLESGRPWPASAWPSGLSYVPCAPRRPTAALPSGRWARSAWGPVRTGPVGSLDFFFGSFGDRSVRRGLVRLFGVSWCSGKHMMSLSRVRRKGEAPGEQPSSKIYCTILHLLSPSQAWKWNELSRASLGTFICVCNPWNHRDPFGLFSLSDSLSFSAGGLSTPQK